MGVLVSDDDGAQPMSSRMFLLVYLVSKLASLVTLAFYYATKGDRQ